MNKIRKYYKNRIKPSENKFFKISRILNNYIYGTLTISHVFNKEYIFRKFEICIKIYDNKFHSCYELNNEIPREYHHHTGEEDIELKTTSLCLGSNAEIKSFLEKTSNLSKFIDMFIIPYFFNFSYFDKFGEEMWSGYSHGRVGIKEYFFDKFNIINEEILIKIMELIQKNKYYLNCPCGSKKAFDRCHYLFVKDIPIKILKNDSFKFFKEDTFKKKWSTKNKIWK
ncbi:hypothetical protein [Cetobacterium sp.]|uniref:hypothetical protein n=1 Tax=Cetobacterium sp. TaxID=2071632 RepID=UPI003F3929C4